MEAIGNCEDALSVSGAMLHMDAPLVREELRREADPCPRLGSFTAW